jgi:hypothetical protein
MTGMAEYQLSDDSPSLGYNDAWRNTCPGTPSRQSMNPEFYLILDADELTEELADAVFEAGFDDSSFTMRG